MNVIISKKLIILAVAALTAIGVLFLQFRPPNVSEISGEFIPYDHLANQETDPFLFLGQVVDEEHPQWSRYKRVLKKYPDVRDCLLKSEQQKERPNLSLIDWGRVGTSHAAEVCVFRIARSLSDVERLLSWLDMHRFSHQGINRYASDTFTPRFETQPIYNLTARWSIEEYRKINPSLIYSITGFHLIQDFRLVISFDQEGLVSGVTVNTPVN